MNDAAAAQTPAPPQPELLASIAEPAPAQRRLRSLSGLWPFLRPYGRQVGYAFVLLCLASAAMLTVPLLSVVVPAYQVVGWRCAT